MIYMIQRNYGSYDGHRSPDLHKEIDTDYGYFADRDKAEEAVEELNRRTYQGYAKSYAAELEAAAKREEDYVLAVEQWKVLIDNGFKPPVPALPSSAKLPEIQPFAEWLAGQDRWSDYTWYTIAEINQYNKEN